MYPSLTVIHTPGRILFYPDLISRQLDNVHLPCEGVQVSKQQALIIPSLQKLSPGSILTNQELKELFSSPLKPELFDINDNTFQYIQRIDWSKYCNPSQYFGSEKEFILGALLSKQNPELAMSLPTLKDVFKLKTEGNHFKTKAQKALFLKTVTD